MRLTKQQHQALKDLAKFISLEIGPQVHPAVAAALLRRGLVQWNRDVRYRSIVLTEKGEIYAASKASGVPAQANRRI